jgi:hypothetical protein
MQLSEAPRTCKYSKSNEEEEKETNNQIKIDA